MRWPNWGPQSPSSTFHNPAPRRQRANWANAGGPLPPALPATSSSPTRCAICPAEFAERFGQIDIIVNCAAFVGTSGLEGWAVPFEQQSDKTWRRALEVNLTAPFVLVQAAAADLRVSGHGSVINISSIYGLSGPDWRLYEGTSLGNPAAYAASKGGLIQATRWLSTTLAPHVRVNAIAPGGVFRDTQEPFLSRYTARTPLGRMGREEDFMGAVAYLATDLSAYVTGQCLAVDGGWTVW